MQTPSLVPQQPTESSASPRFTRQILMIDADDTLWENNIYFERAIDRFIEVVAHPTFSPAEVRSAFDALEAERVKAHGYGTDAFHASLLAGFAHLTGAVCDQASAAEIEACSMHVRGSELVLLQDVAETLSQLAQNHTLFLVTKGDHAEQTTKLVRSGLAKYFSQVEVLREKNESAYLELIHRHGLDPAQTWMIGNSPRSDINPALAAGLHAVYLPHPSTWVLEQEAVATAADPQNLLELASFKDLLLYFE